MENERNDDNIFVSISNDYYHLTAAEKKVADFVLSHKHAVQYMSISELADECGVADATISRFCRRLKLKGYNAFRLALAKAVAEESGGGLLPGEGQEGEIFPDDSVSDLGRKVYNAEITAVSQSLSLMQAGEITRAVNMLSDAERVYCMGQGGSMLLAMDAAHLFSTITSKFSAVMDSHLQASQASVLSERDVLLFFSYSGSTKDLVDLMRIAQNRGAKIILITRFLKSPGAARADVVLQCGSNEGPLQLGSISARMAQLFLLDVLFNEYFRRDPEAARAHQEAIAEALSEKHI